MNGKPAPDVRVQVIATAKIEGKQDEVVLKGAATDPENGGGGLEPTVQDTNEKGQVNFRLFVPRPCTNIRVTVKGLYYQEISKLNYVLVYYKAMSV